MGHGVAPEECRFLTIKKHGNISIYDVVFNSVSEIQLFLGQNPPINNDVFTIIKSETADEAFAGPPLSDAIRYCVMGYQENYDQFLELEKKLESVNKARENARKVEASFVGHRPNVPAYIAGAPKTMYRTQREQEKKIINLYMNVTYDAKVTDEQIRHRGIVALNLVRLLELNGYIVNFRLFEICMVGNEAFCCEVVLKKPGEKLNTRMCYYPMCGKGFVRRVLSRIKESMPFNENWGLSYGTVLKEDYARILMEIEDKDIYIGSPTEMNIKGENIFEDADAMVEKLGIDKYVVIPKYMA